MVWFSSSWIDVVSKAALEECIKLQAVLCPCSYVTTNKFRETVRQVREVLVSKIGMVVGWMDRLLELTAW